jgi:hypothetical protein
VPLSDASLRAVRAVTVRYPDDAQLLLDMVRTAPEVVGRRQTRFGPLNRVLVGNAPMPPEEIELLETFAAEWHRREFDAHELADAIEAALREATGRSQDPGRHRPDAWRTLAGAPLPPGRLFG